MMRRIFLTAMALIFLAGQVFALGVMPARVLVSYEKGGVYQGHLKISNPEERTLFVSAGGELSKYILIDSDVMLPANRSLDVDYRVVLPRNLAPGLHKGEIVIRQGSEKKDNSIQASLGVVSQIYVYVPYPGKYVLADLIVEDAKAKWDTANFIIPVNNLGKADLSSVKAVVDIYDSKGMKVGSVESDEEGLKVGEKKDLRAEWVADVDLGTYTARASVLYDDKSVHLSKEFKVGAEMLSLEKVMVRDFRLGEIAKFEMLVENKWPKAIKDVYSVVGIYDERGEKVDEFKSQSYDFEPLSKSLIASYWDSKGFKPGRYKARVSLRYGDKETRKDLIMDVREDSLRILGSGEAVRGVEKGKVIVAAGVLAVLILGAIVYFVFVRKKGRRKKRK